MEGKAVTSTLSVKKLFLRLRNYDDHWHGKKAKVMDGSCFEILFTGDMSCESERLATFVKNEWSFEVSASEMSSAGFCCVGKDGPVVCFHCKGTISDWTWQHGDIPWRIHRRKFPKCNLAETKEKPSQKGRRAPKGKSRVVFDCTCTTPDVSKSMQSSSKEVTDTNFSYEEYRYDFFSSEYNRLITFRFWPENIPVRGPSLAAAGLYRQDDSSDRLECFACRKVFGGWRESPETLPMVRHLIQSPTCPFGNQQETGNRRITEQEKQQADTLFQSLRQKVQHPTDQNSALSNVNESKPFGKHPRYCGEDVRRRSFESWPKDHCQDPNALANAGFFYLGKDDRVTCFYCGGELLDWEPGDDPIEEHIKHCPECKWIQVEKSKIRVMEMKNMLRTEGSSTKGESVKDTEDDEVSKEVEYEPEEDGLAKKILIESSQECKGDNQEAFPGEQTDTTEKSLRYTEEEEASLTKGFRRLQIGGGWQTSNTSCRTEANMEAEIERLRHQNRCKICLDGDVEILFLPCRHLSACQICSGKVETCPMCREYIDDRLTVFV